MGGAEAVAAGRGVGAATVTENTTGNRFLVGVESDTTWEAIRNVSSPGQSSTGLNFRVLEPVSFITDHEIPPDLLQLLLRPHQHLVADNQDWSCAVALECGNLKRCQKYLFHYYLK